jgi:hypothetical protein
MKMSLCRRSLSRIENENFEPGELTAVLIWLAKNSLFSHERFLLRRNNSLFY